jgi:hypothetical protein
MERANRRSGIQRGKRTGELVRFRVYQLTLLCAFSLIALAAVFAGIRIWKAATGR